MIPVLQESAAENVTVLLLGNKSDCSERRVKTHQGEILAKVRICCITPTHEIITFSSVVLMIKTPTVSADIHSTPQEYDFEFMECSAATGENVIQSLEVVARYVYNFIVFI